MFSHNMYVTVRVTLCAHVHLLLCTHIQSLMCTPVQSMLCTQSTRLHKSGRVNLELRSFFLLLHSLGSGYLACCQSLFVKSPSSNKVEFLIAPAIEGNGAELLRRPV